MDNIIAILGYTIKQHLRHKVYLIVILFGMILIMGGLVLSSLSTGRIRMLMNIGLSSIEFLALITIIFTTVNLILEELESRTIYLMLAHPLKRWEYIAGRYIGTVISIALGMLIMMALHLTLLFLAGWPWQNIYIIAWLCSLGKVVVMSAITLLISLFTTSAVTAMSFSVLIWLLGHFSEELKFLGEKSANLFVKAVVGVIYNITSNFSYYNYRDFWAAAQTPPVAWFGWMIIYTFAYTGICLILSNFLFSQKEF
ncbi:MAG: hypothetical protein A3J83_07055 [Elusimicrobia bacterium RIFOXYA2_FULL_40_6]|nr:MAG: hypothetical protein A3J83_07055 [Elusimicrobia bacterium RIFOXYA2_FULL_40_6]